ncbi:MAG: flagellar hook-basal body complex protein FliE [Burkholderiales bacterium]
MSIIFARRRRCGRSIVPWWAKRFGYPRLRLDGEEHEMPQMGIRAVGMQPAVNAIEFGKQISRGAALPASDQASFGVALRQALQRVSGLQNEATHAASEFQLGNPQVSLEETMIAAQKANVSFQAAVQVRQRLVSVYNEIMSMNV